MRAGTHDHDRFDGDEDQAPAKPPACVFQWHLCEQEPMPDDLPVFAYDREERPRIVHTASGYLFDTCTGENLEGSEIIAWAYVPPLPESEEAEE